MDEIVEGTAVEIADAVSDGRIDPLKVVELHLDRIEELQPRIGAFRSIRRDAALYEAEELGRRTDLAELPLAGVPIPVKDNIDVEGESRLNGSAAYPRDPAPSDHEIVRRLRAAGAIVVGKTTLPELAIWPSSDGPLGIARNPWNAERGAGGSSGGSAAAVASGMVPAAHANDGAGSIRIPSASCGTFGLKPGHGVVPTCANHWFEMAENGPIASTVSDAALLLSVMAGRPEFADVQEPDRRLKIAVSTRPPLKGIRVQREVKEAVLATAELLQRAGHRVIPDDPPYNASARTAAIARWFAGPVADAEGIDRSRLEKRTRRHVRAGEIALKLNLVRDSQCRRWEARVRPFFERYDVLLLPTVASTALEIGPWNERSWLRNVWTSLNFAPFTGLWNFAPFPAASVPAGFAGGLPVGVQLVGGPGREALILALSKQIESLRPWPRKAPL